MNSINVIDLFCGCGGMSKGLTDAGLNIIAGIDIWDKAINSYKKNFDHQAICEDLTKLPPEEFDNLYNKENKNIDLIVGGPPCQGFSIAGKRDIKDPRNSLFMEYVKYINYFHPKTFIMENVIGILSMKTDKNEKVIDIILSLLNIHYNCIVTKLYASDFEVPQNRRRVIIIGIRKDLNIIPIEPTPIVSFENRIPVKNILLNKNEIDSSYYLSEKALLGIQNKKNKAKENGNGFGAQFLNFDKPSYTIPARYWKDGYDALVKYSDTEIRRLTILELKRIQSFPDDYILEGSKKDIIMQIGNAVACKFAYHLGKYITNILQ
jgi:DNA (cytosine-5)-methyltransferase 1